MAKHWVKKSEFKPGGEKGNYKYNLGKKKLCISQLWHITRFSGLSRPVLQVLQRGIRGLWGQPVPGPGKIPQLGAHKSLINLSLVR